MYRTAYSLNRASKPRYMRPLRNGSRRFMSQTMKDSQADSGHLKNGAMLQTFYAGKVFNDSHQINPK